MSETYDLIVIGGGSAGLVAAGGAGILGAKVALIEKAKLGGDCLWTGCVPSKTFIRSARLASDMRNAEKYGFEKVEPTFKGKDFASITGRVQDVIGVIEEHDAPEVFEEMGAEVIFGTPKFTSKNEIEVKLRDGTKQTMKSKRFCISTGSSPFIPPIEGLEETGYITNEEVFHVKELPETMVVLGGGVIGVELGQSFQRYGSNVTLIEMNDRILKQEDEEVSALMQGVLEKDGMKVLTETKAVKFYKTEDGKKVVTVERNGKQEEFVCDEILAAVGRKANSDNLGLEAAGVETERGKIKVDDYLRTTNKAIYAAGDINGKFQFTHMADYEAQIVLKNCFLFFPLMTKTDYRVVPWATFTEPEIARVGMVEKEAKEKYGADKVKVYKVHLDHNDRALAEGEPEGFAKLVLKGKKILGVTIVGIHSGELISEFTVAMKHGLSIAQLNEAIHVYPTLAKVTQALGTESTIEGLKKDWVQKWFGRYLKIWR